MIYKASPDEALRLGTAFQRVSYEKFSICYRGVPLSLPAGDIITSEDPEPGYELLNLYSDVYGEYVLWPAPVQGVGLTLTASFPLTNIDTIILGDCGYNKIRILVRKGNTIVLDSTKVWWITHDIDYITTHVQADGRVRRIIFDLGADSFQDLDRQYAPGLDYLDPTDQKAIPILLPNLIEADSIEFVFDEGIPRLGKLWIGERDEFLLPSTLNYPLSTVAVGGLTDIGTIYGKKFPPRRSIKAKWDVMDDMQRRVFEDYMADVQTCIAHWIIPFRRKWDMCFMPPAFVRLKTAKMDDKKIDQGWYWDGADMEWEVLK